MEHKSESYEAFVINDRLRNFFGIHEEANLPRFRVIFSDDQIERRFGEFEHYSGEIYLRTEKSIQQVHKYSWLDGQWVVERLHPNIHKDVYDGDFTYEPLYVFPAMLPLKWEMVEIVAKKALEILPIEIDERRTKTQKQAEDDLERRISKEKAEYLNMMDNTALQSALHDGGAVQIKSDDMRIKE